MRIDDTPELAKARSDVESMFKLGPSGNYYFAATGEEYIELCSAGYKNEGDSIPAWFSTPDMAIEFWKRAVIEYAASVDGEAKTLYWRVPPELGEWAGISLDAADITEPSIRDACTRKLYTVYSRLLISSKPQIQPAMLPPLAA